MSEPRFLDDLSEADFALEIKMIRERLQAQIAEVEASVESAESTRASAQLDPSRVGRLSRVDALQMVAMERALEERRRAEGLRAQRALELIEEGSYGECVLCYESIALKRIRLDPSLLTCVGCA